MMQNNLNEKEYRYRADWSRYVALPSRTLAGLEEVEAAYSPAGSGGFPLYSEDGAVKLVDSRVEHTLFVAPTGGGKTTGMIKPTILDLAKQGISIVAPDLMGNLYLNDPAIRRALKEAGYTVYCLDFINHDKDGVNIFSDIVRSLKSGDLAEAERLSNSFMTSLSHNAEPNPKDPYWRDTSCMKGGSINNLILRTVDAIDPEKREMMYKYVNIATLVELTSDQSTEPLLRQLEDDRLKGSLKNNLVSCLDLPDNTRRCVNSTLQSYLHPFVSSQGRAAMLSTEGYSPETLLEPKTAVFLCMPAGDTSAYELGGFLINQTLDFLKEYATRNQGKLPCPVAFLLDEVANFRPRDLDITLSTVRNFGIRILMACQGLEQLSSVYGNKTPTILANCANLVLWGGCSEASTLSAFSDRSGRVDGRNLLTVEDLYSIPRGQAYYSCDFGRLQFVTTVTGCYSLKEYQALEQKKTTVPIPKRVGSQPETITGEELAGLIKMLKVRKGSSFQETFLA